MKKQSRKRKKVTRQAATRADDRARVAREEHDATPVGVWASVRDRYDETTRSIVDGIASNGLTLADVLMLEVAEHQRLSKSIDRVLSEIEKDTGSVGHKTLAALCSVQLQGRKHMRTILLSMGPGLTVNDMQVDLPTAADMALLREAREELDSGGDEILS